MSRATALDQAVLVDRSARLRMSFHGDKAVGALGGLLTNDVAALAPMGVMRAVALTPKGRVIALVRVIRRAGDVLVDTEAAAGEGFAAMIRKFVNPRIAKHAVVTDSTDSVGVYGATAADEVARAVGLDGTVLRALPATQSLASADSAITVLRSDEFGSDGFDLIGARDAIAAARASFVGSGIPALADDALEIAAVERGIPRFGIEMDGETIPQEANLDRLGAISFNKGCYTGQEVVARIHFRGHVNRHLRRLIATAPLARGDVVVDATGKEVGDVRSAVVSPAQGPIAVAMVRREVEPGSEVEVRHGDERVTARCEALV